MPLLILTIGIPSCGKTTWVKDFLKKAPATKVVSNDDIREELFGTRECDHTQNWRVYSTARERAKALLTSGADVIVDATNTSIGEWMAYRRILGDNDVFVAKVFSVTPETAIERQKGRERKVPEEVIQAKWEELERSKHWLYSLFNFLL